MYFGKCTTVKCPEKFNCSKQKISESFGYWTNIHAQVNRILDLFFVNKLFLVVKILNHHRSNVGRLSEECIKSFSLVLEQRVSFRLFIICKRMSDLQCYSMM